MAVSVIMPAFNADRYLREAIDSVLSQTRRPLELIVVDDGSTDDTAAVAASYGPPVRVVASGQRVRNIGGARNVGVGVSLGKVLAFLDADDYWEPDWLELAMAALGADPPPDMVFGRLREFISPDLEPEEAARLLPGPEDRPAYCASGTLVTRDTYERIGEFNSSNPGAEFTDWLMRARDMGLAESVVDKVTISRRLHLTNTSRVRRELLSDHAVAIKASLDRRRASGQL